MAGTGGLLAYAQEPLAEEPFSALLEASSADGTATQARVEYEPSSSCTIAVRRGRLIVRLSNDQIVKVKAGTELVIELGPRDVIVSTKVGKPAFSADEGRVWTTQLKKLR